MSENQENNQNTVQNVQPNPVQQTQTQQNTNYTNYQNNNTIPNEYKPLSAWAYFGYQLLFAIPLVGFIMLIVFAFDNSNLNRRNFARSYFCAWLVAFIIIAVVFIIFFVILGTGFAAFSAASGPALSSF